MLLEKGLSLSETFDTVAHEINRGALDKKHPFRYVVLSTQQKECVKSRYVVLREVDKELSLYVYTDARTGKVSDLETSPFCSVLMYHKSKKVQVRITGQAELHRQDDIAEKHWKDVKGNAQKAYGSTVSPGTELELPDEAHEWPADINNQFFTVIKVVPKTIEALQLNGHEHLRAKFIKNKNGWLKNWIAP